MRPFTTEEAALYQRLLTHEPGLARLRYGDVRIVPHEGRRFLALRLDHPEVVEPAWLFFHPDGASEAEIAELTGRMGATDWTTVSRDDAGKLILGGSQADE